MNRARTVPSATRNGVTSLGRRLLPASAKKWLRRKQRGLSGPSKSAPKRGRVEQLYTYSFPLVADTVPGVDRGYRLREADEKTLAELRAKHPRELSERKLALLQARVSSPSEICWLFIDEAGEVAGYGHVALASTLNARINHRVVVKPHQAYFFDDYVFKRYRGKGLHAFAIAERVRLLSAAGRTEGLMTISKGNVASAASFRKFGMQQRQRLLFFRGAGRTVSMPTLAYLRRLVSRSGRR